MIVTSFVDLQKISLFPKFGGCGSKIEPAKPILFSNSMGTRFVPNMKVLGAQNLDFPPKLSKTSNCRGRFNF